MSEKPLTTDDDMAARRYGFDEERGQIGGVIDPRGTYYVIEGHHRMAAALEIFHETGDENVVIALIQFGRWSHVENPPIDGRPFPSRSIWGAFRNWLGY